MYSRKPLRVYRITGFSKTGYDCPVGPLCHLARVVLVAVFEVLWRRQLVELRRESSMVSESVNVWTSEVRGSLPKMPHSSPKSLHRKEEGVPKTPHSSPKSLYRKRKQLVEWVLEMTEFDLTKASGMLGIDQVQLVDNIRLLGVELGNDAQKQDSHSYLGGHEGGCSCGAFEYSAVQNAH